MNILTPTWRGMRRMGSLLRQSNDLSVRSGVWATRVSREALLVQFLLLMLFFMVQWLLWWTGGKTEKSWIGCVMMASGIPIVLTSMFLSIALDKDPDRPPSMRAFLLWAGITGLVGVPLAHLVFWLAQHIQPFAQTKPFLRFFPELMLGFIIGLSYWRLMIIRLWHERLATEELKRRSAEQGQALAETRLHMLQAQIEPHFLFNTLASVQHLVRKDPAQADFLLAELISYLRQAIPEVRGAASTLGREFASIRTYLNIVSVRMAGRLTVTVHCDPALSEVALPSLLVHTLVENAIRHGVEMKTGPVSISVLATPGAHGTIEISVADDGVGLGVGPAVSGGVGLRNVRDRLALAFDGQARLAIGDAPGGGVLATITIPGASA